MDVRVAARGDADDLVGERGHVDDEAEFVGDFGEEVGEGSFALGVGEEGLLDLAADVILQGEADAAIGLDVGGGEDGEAKGPAAARRRARGGGLRAWALK